MRAPQHDLLDKLIILVLSYNSLQPRSRNVCLRVFASTALSHWPYVTARTLARYRLWLGVGDAEAPGTAPSSSSSSSSSPRVLSPKPPSPFSLRALFGAASLPFGSTSTASAAAAAAVAPEAHAGGDPLSGGALKRSAFGSGPLPVMMPNRLPVAPGFGGGERERRGCARALVVASPRLHIALPADSGDHLGRTYSSICA